MGPYIKHKRTLTDKLPIVFLPRLTDGPLALAKEPLVLISQRIEKDGIANQFGYGGDHGHRSGPQPPWTLRNRADVLKSRENKN